MFSRRRTAAQAWSSWPCPPRTCERIDVMSFDDARENGALPRIYLVLAEGVSFLSSMLYLPSLSSKVYDAVVKSTVSLLHAPFSWCTGHRLPGRCSRPIPCG